MKNFSELISWELEQERRGRLRRGSAADAAGRLNDSLLRKRRYLSLIASGTNGKAGLETA